MQDADDRWVWWVGFIVIGNKDEVMIMENEVRRQRVRQEDEGAWLGVSAGEMRGIVAGRDGGQVGTRAGLLADEW